jgi:hypothetical protein
VLRYLNVFREVRSQLTQSNNPRWKRRKRPMLNCEPDVCCWLLVQTPSVAAHESNCLVFVKRISLNVCWLEMQSDNSSVSFVFLSQDDIFPGVRTTKKVKQSRYTPWRRLGGERRHSSYYSFTTSALDGGEWSASLPDRAFTPGTHCTGGWVGPRSGLDTEVRGKNPLPLPGIEPRSSSP